MMVLLVKQVHLQNVGAAGRGLLLVRRRNLDVAEAVGDLHAAATKVAHAPSRRRRKPRRCIVSINLCVLRVTCPALRRCDGPLTCPFPRPAQWNGCSLGV